MDENREIVLNLELKFKSGLTFESFISKLQPSVHDAILCVKDGSEVLIFTKREHFPRLLKFEGVVDDVYYYRSEENMSLYAVFGSEAASIFYPKINNRGKTVAKINRSGLVSRAISRSNKTAKLVQSELN